jgi:hypothetical protein
VTSADARKSACHDTMRVSPSNDKGLLCQSNTKRCQMRQGMAGRRCVAERRTPNRLQDVDGAKPSTQATFHQIADDRSRYPPSRALACGITHYYDLRTLSCMHRGQTSRRPYQLATNVVAEKAAKHAGSTNIHAPA